MLALETKQSGGKLLPHSDLRVGVFPGEASRSRQRGVKIGTWNEVGCGYMDWIGLAQERDRWRTLVSAAMNLPVP